LAGSDPHRRSGELATLNDLRFAFRTFTRPAEALHPGISVLRTGNMILHAVAVWLLLAQAHRAHRRAAIRALLAIQDDAQLTTVTLHARTRLNYPASDLRSSKSLAEAFGKTTIATETSSQNRGRYASRSLSRGETGRDLLMADEVRTADPRQCWILTPDLLTDPAA
jgi:hypothetical protein